MTLRTRLDRSAGGAQQARQVILLAGVLGLSAADTATVGAIALPLERGLSIGNTQIGLLVTASTAVAALPLGVLADRVDRVRLLTAAIVVWSAVLLRVYRVASCATAVAAMSRSATRARGCRPCASTAAASRPYCRATRWSTASERNERSMVPSRRSRSARTSSVRATSTPKCSSASDALLIASSPVISSGAGPSRTLVSSRALMRRRGRAGPGRRGHGRCPSRGPAVPPRRRRRRPSAASGRARRGPTGQSRDRSRSRR